MRLLNHCPNKSMSEMYNPKEFKFCFHVDTQQVHIKPCKISSKELVGGFRRAVASRAIFFQLRSQIGIGAKVSEEPESSFSIQKSKDIKNELQNLRAYLNTRILV